MFVIARTRSRTVSITTKVAMQKHKKEKRNITIRCRS